MTVLRLLFLLSDRHNYKTRKKNIKDKEENIANMNDVKKNKCVSFRCVENN